MSKPVGVMSTPEAQWSFETKQIHAGQVADPLVERLVYLHRAQIRVGEFLRGLANLMRGDRYEEGEDRRDEGLHVHQTSSPAVRFHAPREVLIGDGLHDRGGDGDVRDGHPGGVEDRDLPRRRASHGIAREQRLRGPALVIVGEVVRLADADARPLSLSIAS